MIDIMVTHAIWTVAVFYTMWMIIGAPKSPLFGVRAMAFRRNEKIDRLYALALMGTTASGAIALDRFFSGAGWQALLLAFMTITVSGFGLYKIHSFTDAYKERKLYKSIKKD